jgi:hypothetical protein
MDGKNEARMARLSLRESMLWYGWGFPADWASFFLLTAAASLLGLVFLQ